MRLNTTTNSVLQLVSDFPGLPADTYLGMQCADEGNAFRISCNRLTAAVIQV